MRHNNVLPNAHLHKDWQRRVKTWFNQAGKKESRRLARSKKAALIAPRPLDGPLRPAVRCPTVKYNIKLRAGRGFTLDELKEAGISAKFAKTVGIAIDHRRRNKSVESMQLNVERLKAYKSKLIVFPKKAGKPKKGDSSEADLKAATQLKGDIIPIVSKTAVEAPRAIKAEEKEFKAFATLRKARVEKRLKGIRTKQAKEKAEEEAQKAK